MPAKLAIAAALLLTACIADSEPPPATTHVAESSGDVPDIGEACGDNDTCADDLTCVTYVTIAGTSGPELKTCELPCKADSECPTSYSCITITDGPGRVCRETTTTL